MRIPESLRIAYDEQLSVITEVRSRVEARLRVLCANHGWLFDHRTKSPESVVAKLQLGELASIEEMCDFYGAMVVAPTLADVDAAAEAIQASFHSAERRERPPGHPEAFVYDDVHVIVTLGPLGPLDPTGLVGTREVEVQVRTGLQYAWWKSTHDVLYKGSSDWRLRRAAAELRAQLQGLDRALADLEGYALGITQPPGVGPDPEDEAIAGWQGKWEPEARPEDPRRFVITVRAYVTCAGLAVDEVEQLLNAEAGRAFISNTSLTPAQAVLLALVSARGVAFLGALRASGRRVLVTREMAALSPLLGGLPSHDVVQFGARMAASSEEPVDQGGASVEEPGAAAERDASAGASSSPPPEPPPKPRASPEP